MKNILHWINEQEEFFRASIYVLGGFSIVLAGYGVGRLVGMVVF